MGETGEVTIAENVPNWGKDKRTILTSLAIPKKLTQRKPCPATSQRAPQNPPGSHEPKRKGMRAALGSAIPMTLAFSPKPLRPQDNTEEPERHFTSLSKRRTRKAEHCKLPTRYSGKGRRTDRRKVGGLGEGGVSGHQSYSVSLHVSPNHRTAPRGTPPVSCGFSR